MFHSFANRLLDIINILQKTDLVLPVNLLFFFFLFLFVNFFIFLQNHSQVFDILRAVWSQLLFQVCFRVLDVPGCLSLCLQLPVQSLFDINNFPLLLYFLFLIVTFVDVLVWYFFIFLLLFLALFFKLLDLSDGLLEDFFITLFLRLL